MKKTVVIVTLLFAAFTSIGCKKQEQKQQPVVYAPASPPLPMEIDQRQQAAKMTPQSAEVWISLGNAMMDSQRFGEAVDAYEKAIALQPKNVNVLVDLGTCYRGIGKFDKAVELYQRALKINPSFPNGHLNLGVVLGFDLHKKAEAIKELNQYIALVPPGPEADNARRAIQELSAGVKAGK